MKTFTEYQTLTTWQEKQQYHRDCEDDETVTLDNYNRIDIAYWKEYYEREEMFEQDICPDCRASIQRDRIEYDGNYVDETTCDC